MYILLLSMCMLLKAFQNGRRGSPSNKPHQLYMFVSSIPVRVGAQSGMVASSVCHMGVP